MATRTMRVNRWGNSLGIRFPNEFVDNVQLKEKSLVEITSDGERLIITKVKEREPRKTIQELFAEHPADYIEDEEIDWGAPIGGEVW
ncbi:MAG: AbrB/MazE/SpoVT family DNA-binding domain-containing protein [Defluviitaleaceae bacterium]|nr:AbrB/MazE/SpoVT family DNA-binding domain-containing protein [Defluviitaleaceae bacterium]